MNSFIVLLFAQFFGIMPVSGIFANDTRYVYFNWISVKSITSLILTLFAIIEVSTVLILAVKGSVTLALAGVFKC